MPSSKHKMYNLFILALFLPLSGAFLYRPPLPRAYNAYLHTPKRGPIMKRATDPENIWQDIYASQKLQWQDCYPDNTVKFQCARLLVPLNYSAPFSSSNQASIALIRTPSPYPKESKDYKGPILFNPGGPGDSGVHFVLTSAPLFRSILGDAFDLVGFDPRGVARSLPAVSFFNSSADRSVFTSRLSAYEVINASTNSIAEFVANVHILGAMAEANNNINGSFLDNINTEFTARDMLTIAQAHGRDKLKYWGFSYGSVLGATFAALFPDKVDRLIIDGVDDAEDYYSTAWRTNLLDTDKVLQTFFDGCFAAGPSKCAFYAPSPQAISQNLQQIYNNVASRPIFVASNVTNTYGVVDYNLVRSSVFFALYAPYTFFAPLAQSLAALLKGDGRPLWDVIQSVGSIGSILDQQVAIACNDGNPIPGTVEDAESYFDVVKNFSQYADYWAPNTRLSCSGWPVLPKHFQGPFTVNTSFPLLLIGNTADPVTPLANAKKMSAGFAGSVVLTQDSPGHSSLTAPSTCTAKYVRAYFENGTLPQQGTVCPVLGSLFSASSNGINGTGSTSVNARDAKMIERNLEDLVLVDAFRKMSRSRLLGSF